MLQNSYDLIADEWHENSIHDARVARTLSYVDRLLDGLPPRATVLDLGCGTGNPIARHIIDRGFHVVGGDQSQKMLAIAQRVIPEADAAESGDPGPGGRLPWHYRPRSAGT